MKSVLTLTATPRIGRATPVHLEISQAALKRAGAQNVRPRWVQPNICAEVDYEGLDFADAITIARTALAGASLDFFTAPRDDRKMGMLVCDMDSTITNCEFIDELAKAYGVGDKVAEITQKAMEGKVPFAKALEQRVALLKGADESLLEKVGKKIKLNEGAETLVKTMKKNGAVTLLVSGSFSPVVEKIAKKAGFEHCRFNQLAVRGGKLTGKLKGTVLDGAGKAKAMKDLAKKNKIPLSKVLAVGDGANDLQMIKAAGFGVAYHGKPKLVEAADATIKQSDLTALLYCQGYKAKEFVK